MLKIFYGIICCFIFNIQVFADTSLWKVEANGHDMYLGGTCHILRQSDYPLPVEFEKAYANSTLIAFEADLNGMKSPDAIQAIVRSGMYLDGNTLKEQLSIETYTSLKEYCASTGLSIEMFNQMKPWLMLVTLLGVELKKLGVSESGVDSYYYQKAHADGKSIEALETVEQQIEIISSMGRGYEDLFITYSIRDLSKTHEIINNLISIWKNGDNEKLEELYLEPMKKECPELYSMMLVARNNQWMEKIESYLKTPETELVLVGVAHLVGEDGLITILQNRGYAVKKY